MVKYFKEVIEEQSTPEYASEDVAKLDEFVRNGGKLEDYFSITPDIDVDNVDIENENEQKIVLRELLARKGYSDKQIAKKIERFEDAGVLEDEARDAVEELQEIVAKEKEELLEQQRIKKEEMVQRQQKFFDDVAVIAASFQHQRGRRGSYRNSCRTALCNGHSLYCRSRFPVPCHDIESFFQFCNCFLALCRDIIGDIALFGDFRPQVIQLHNARVVIGRLKCFKCGLCIVTTCIIVIRQNDNHLVGKVCDILIFPMGAIRQADRRETIFRKRVNIFLAFNQEDCFRLFQYRSIIRGTFFGLW